MSWSEEHVLRRRLVDAGMAVFVEEDRIPGGEAARALARRPLLSRPHARGRPFNRGQAAGAAALAHICEGQGS